MPWIAGLDLAQASDRSALVMVEMPKIEKPRTYLVRHLERFQLGTPYPQVVERLRTLLNRKELMNCRLAVDMTGVGRPVVDLLKQAGLEARIWPISITSGKAVTVDGYSYCVPKRDLVGVLQVLLQTGRLKISGKLSEGAQLIRELTDFRAKFTQSANEVFGPEKASQHDDLVLALALATWTGERLSEPFEMPFMNKPQRTPEREMTPYQKIMKDFQEQDDREDFGHDIWRWR
jgi:hypothetical protein